MANQTVGDIYRHLSCTRFVVRHIYQNIRVWGFILIFRNTVCLISGVKSFYMSSSILSASPEKRASSTNSTFIASIYLETGFRWRFYRAERSAAGTRYINKDHNYFGQERQRLIIRTSRSRSKELLAGQTLIDKQQRKRGDYAMPLEFESRGSNPNLFYMVYPFPPPSLVACDILVSV